VHFRDKLSVLKQYRGTKKIIPQKLKSCPSKKKKKLRPCFLPGLSEISKAAENYMYFSNSLPLQTVTYFILLD